MYRRIVSHGLDYTTHFQLVGETFLSAILVAMNVPPQMMTAKRAERVGRARDLGMEVSFGEMPNYKSTFDVGGYLLYNDFMNSERGIMPKPEEEVESAIRRTCMAKDLIKTLTIIGILVFIVIVASWFVFPEWRTKSGGIWLLVTAALTGVLATIKSVLDIYEKLFKKTADSSQTTTSINQGTRIENVETLVVQTISAPLPDHNEGHSVPAKVLHNLPQPDYGHFIDRDEEIKKIVERLRPYPHSQYHIATIYGIGGVGKSALALEIAHRYLFNYEQLPPDERFDAIVWVSAKQTILTAEGIKTRPQALRTLSDIYAAIAVTLQREDITRTLGETEQSTLVRSLLSRQHFRTLLILDNLETVDDENVRTFIKELPAPTKLIVTTRHYIDAPFPIHLLGMHQEDANKLISQECEKKEITLSDKDAQSLFERTAGVPLAIVWSLALMGIGYKVETVLEKLGDAEEDISQFCFKETLQAIYEKPAYKLLLSLALFVTDASRDALGYISELPLRDRDDGLVRLQVLSLADKRADRFALLPLTKTYALAELKKKTELNEKLNRRWIDYLKSICAGVDSEYYWRYRSYAFYHEGETILDAIQWCREHGPAEDAIFLTSAAYDFLEVTGRWNEMQILVTDILGLAESLKNELAIARLYNIIAWILMQQGKLDEAEPLYLIGLETYRNQNNQAGEAIILHHLSAIYRKRRQFQQAEKYCQQAEDVACKSGNADLQALVQGERGKLARDQQNWLKAKKIFTELTEYFEKRVEQTPRDEPLARSTWGHLAIVAYHLGNFEEAKQLCLKSLEFFESLGTKGYMAVLKYRLALAEDALGQKTEALGHAAEAVDWFDRLGMKPDYLEAKKLLARLEPKARKGI